MKDQASGDQLADGCVPGPTDVLAGWSSRWSSDTAPPGWRFAASVAAWLVFELVMQVRQRLRAVGPAAADPTVFVLVPCLAGAVAAAQVLGRRGGLTWPGGLLWPVVAGVTLIAADLGVRAWSITTLGRLFQYQITIQPGHRVVTSGPTGASVTPPTAGWRSCSPASRWPVMTCGAWWPSRTRSTSGSVRRWGGGGLVARSRPDQRRRRRRVTLVAAVVALTVGLGKAGAGNSVLSCFGYAAGAFLLTAFLCAKLWVSSQNGKRNIRMLWAAVLPVRVVHVVGLGSVRLRHRYRAPVLCSLAAAGIAAVAGVQTGSAGVASSMLFLLALIACLGFFSARQVWRTARGLAVSPDERALLEKVSHSLGAEFELTERDPRRARHMAVYLAVVWIATVAVTMAVVGVAPTWRSVSAHISAIFTGIVFGLLAGALVSMFARPLRGMFLSPLRQGPGDWMVDKLRQETLMVAQLGCRRPRRAELRLLAKTAAESARRMLMPGPAVAVSRDPHPAVLAAPRTLILHESVLKMAAGLRGDAGALGPLVQHGLAHIRLGHPLTASFLVQGLERAGPERHRRGDRHGPSGAPGETGRREKVAALLAEFEREAEQLVEELGLRPQLPAQEWRCVGREGLGDDPGDMSGEARIADLV